MFERTTLYVFKKRMLHKRGQMHATTFKNSHKLNLGVKYWKRILVFYRKKKKKLQVFYN